MKKFLSCLLALLMTASLLAGCGQQKTDDNNGGDVAEPTQIGRASCRERV